MAGSIEERGKNKYRLTVSMGSGKNRKRYRRTVTCKNKTQANKELAKFVAEIEGDNFIEPSKVTFEAFAQKWLEEHAYDLAPATVQTYEGYLDKIIPFFGSIKLSEIKPLQLLEFYSYLGKDYKKKDGKPLSNNSIIKYHRLLKIMFGSAVKWNLIKENPVDKVDPPKYQKPKSNYYDEKEVKELIQSLEKEPIKYVAAILLTIATGVRRGELMGLEWRHIDFKNNTITIEQANQYLSGKGIFTKEPKTESSIREIIVPKSTMATLKKHKNEERRKMFKLGELWEGGELENSFVFTQWNGKPMHLDTIPNWFKKFQERKGLRRITFHQLRHTSATMLVNAGLNVQALSARLGHSNTSTTLNIYSHALKSADKVAAEKIDDIMFQNEDKNAK